MGNKNMIVKTAVLLTAMMIYFATTVTGFAATKPAVTAPTVKLVVAELQDAHHYDVLAGTILVNTNKTNETVGVKYTINGTGKTLIAPATFDALKKDGTALYKFAVNITDKATAEANGLNLTAVNLDNKGNVLKTKANDPAFELAGAKANPVLAAANVNVNANEFTWNENVLYGTVQLKKVLNAKNVDIYYLTNDNNVWKRTTATLQNTVGTNDTYTFEVPVLATTNTVKIMVGTKADGIAKIDHTNRDNWTFTR